MIRSSLTALLAGVLLAAGCGAPPPPGQPPAGTAGTPARPSDPKVPEAFDQAFRFASAIETDPGDRAAAQQAAVLELVELGRLEPARELALRMEGWRRGVALAETALALARAGRADEARALLPGIERAAGGAEGWRGPRVRAHLALALAVLGDEARSRELAEDLAANDPRQYAGRATAVLAAAFASAGRADEAFEALDSLAASEDLDLVSWRTEGWLELARHEGLETERRREALGRARVSAEAVPGWRRVTLLEEVAELQLEAGLPEQARESLSSAQSLVDEMEPRAPARSALLAGLAGAWARLGEAERARSLIEQARPGLENALVIERPALAAALAGSLAELGDEAGARAGHEQALELAAGLVNARPRALAVSAVCRSLGRHGLPVDDELRARLDELHAGLGAPW